MKNLHHWLIDYLHAIHGQSLSFIYRNPPSHYLGHIVIGKKPIILIPGVFEKWQFLKSIADPLSLMGYPLYTLEHLGYNTKEIHITAKLIRELIDEKGLKDVIIIAHSKGGLIGKDILISYNHDQKVKKVIAIATPFGGSGITKFISHRVIEELSPQSEIIRKLSMKKEVNHKIVSIFGTFDNHVWPESSSSLEGAKNIQLKVHGHHRILFSKKVREIILSEIGKD